MANNPTMDAPTATDSTATSSTSTTAADSTNASSTASVPTATNTTNSTSSTTPESLESSDPKSVKPNIKRKTRRGIKRSYNKYKSINFNVVAQNVNSIMSKKESLLAMLNSLSPCSILLQETKVKKVGSLVLEGYQFFEKIRRNKEGGGLLTAALNALNPVVIDTDEDAEILVIEITVHEAKVRLINAYGP